MNRRIFSLCVLLIATAQAGEVYLTDCHDALGVTSTQAWGKLGLDTGVVPPGRTPNPLRIGKTIYKKGYGHHAKGEIVVPLPAGALSFRCLAGVQYQESLAGSVVLAVLVDGKECYRSPVLSVKSAPQKIEVDLRGARQLVLRAGDNGDGIGCDVPNWVDPVLVLDGSVPQFEAMQLRLNGTDPIWSFPHAGLTFATVPDGPQALIAPATSWGATVVLPEDSRMELALPVAFDGKALSVACDVRNMGSRPVTLQGPKPIRIERAETRRVEIPYVLKEGKGIARLALRAPGATWVRVSNWTYSVNDAGADLRWEMPRLDEAKALPPPVLPPPLHQTEMLLVEWDWRCRDGIETERESRTYAQAVERMIEQGQPMFEARVRRDPRRDFDGKFLHFVRDAAGLKGENVDANGIEWHTLWRNMHHAKRELLLSDPRWDRKPLAFVKRVPSSFSHQLTQYYGSCARPGGGVFVLSDPGSSMATRCLTEDLPPGAYQHLEVGYDADRLLFSFCPCDAPPVNRLKEPPGRFYSIYEVKPDGSGLKRLTHGEFDDFAPRELPDGNLVFSSTRRGGWHRCGGAPGNGCRTYVLTTSGPNGEDPQPISRHETNEWDAAVLQDGRLIYTRWDYVDRNAVHYQHLWSSRPDGTMPSAYFGNATLNPAGIWEPRSVFGTQLVMATAAAHHAMTAGSIILVDSRRGRDGLRPLTRLTPDVRFPETEGHLAPKWYAPGGPRPEPPPPEEERRWPGHNYRSAFPLDTDLFLVAYSFDRLIGEPSANRPNMFGLYLADTHGNRELIYRDLNVGSLWPMPLRPRPRPPVMANVRSEEETGVFVIQDVNEADPPLPPGTRITALRIVQVLPKSTPGANWPRLGLANASPGKQVLGTVPVAADGSACFRVPADTPVCFQLLDERGRAVQMMRSDTWVRAGETSSCIGCHEPRLKAPLPRRPLAASSPPATIKPPPDGGNPLSYPLLVQPVLDRHCIRCHSGEKPAAKLILTGKPRGHYTESYAALAPRTAYTAWGLPGDFRKSNSEPITRPDHFGARNSKLIAMLDKGHQKVKLTADDWDRLHTWIDANSLFYGTFFHKLQKQQQLGKRIPGSGLE
ncbi:MAG: hypothetical protein HN849_21595 [Victivallales bacterium]|nr:hypothetical protein [Victivallales bacterium]